MSLYFNPTQTTEMFAVTLFFSVIRVLLEMSHGDGCLNNPQHIMKETQPVKAQLLL